MVWIRRGYFPSRFVLVSLRGFLVIRMACRVWRNGAGSWNWINYKDKAGGARSFREAVKLAEESIR